MVGLGRVGFHTFDELTPSRVPVLGIDQRSERAEQLIAHLGDRVLFAVGDAFDEAVLRAAGLPRAAAVVACLSDDRDNYLLGVTARAVRPDIRLLVRLVDPANAVMLADLSGAEVVHPPTITGRRVANLLARPAMQAFTDALIAADNHTRELVEVPCRGRLVGARLGDLLPEDAAGRPADLLIIGHRRGNEARLSFRPPPETRLGAGDMLLALAPRQAVRTLEERLATAAAAPCPAPPYTTILARPDLEATDPRAGTPAAWRGHVVIAGAGTVGRAIAKALRRLGLRVCIIERDPEMLARCAHDEPGAVVSAPGAAPDHGADHAPGHASCPAEGPAVHLVTGDVFDRQVLLDAGLPPARAFISALQSLRDNLFLCAVVRHTNPHAEILSRAGTATEKRRLRSTGAQVFNPGEVGGDHLARLALHPELVAFADGLEATLERTEQLALIPAGPALAGKTLAELSLETRTGCILLGLRPRGAATFRYHPEPTARVEPGATLVALGEAPELDALTALAAGG